MFGTKLLRTRSLTALTALTINCALHDLSAVPTDRSIDVEQDGLGLGFVVDRVVAPLVAGMWAVSKKTEARSARAHLSLEFL